jgi:hypothetical protein
MQRSGTTVTECAVIGPLTFVFVIGLILGAIGIFRYQEVASLARRGARWASVRGTQYAKDTGNAAATPADIYNQAIVPYAAGYDLTRLNSSVTWNQNNAPYQTIVDINGNLVATQNVVSVTVSYQWLPDGFFGGITLSSTSVMPMSN